MQALDALGVHLVKISLVLLILSTSTVLLLLPDSTDLDCANASNLRLKLLTIACLTITLELQHSLFDRNVVVDSSLFALDLITLFDLKKSLVK